MSGIYLHIPFCRQACSYCDFHFSTLRHHQPAMVKALIQELEQRAPRWPGGQMSSVYLGGGTPSLLSVAELESLLLAVERHFNLHPRAEITLEANPDDLSPEYLRQLRALGINRLSIGLQSFDDRHLRLMNRSHTAAQSRQCLDWLPAAGFDNYTVDLIYGVPGQSLQHWKNQLAELAQIGPPHFSAYALTIEPRTALEHQIRTGALALPDEERVAAHFAYLQEWATGEAYRHYELSNLARQGFRARHNSSYWQGKPYLGLGPGAHSYDGRHRFANVASNPRYLKALQLEAPAGSWEELEPGDRYNEYVMTRLRLDEGFSWSDLEAKFGPELSAYARREAQSALERGQLAERDDRLFIPPEWRFHTDGLAAQLFALIPS